MTARTPIAQRQAPRRRRLAGLGVGFAVGLAAVAVVAAALAAAAPTSAPPASMRAAIAALDACVRRLDPEIDVGLGRIERLCPGLAALLESSGAAANLPDDWKRARGELSAGSLRALRAALAGRGRPAPRRALPDTRVLQALLDDRRGEAAAEGGAWARFKRWVRSIVDGLEADEREPDPFARFSELTLPQRVWTILGYAAVAALLVFAAAMIRAELRAAGVTGAGPQPARGAGANVEGVRDDAVESLAAVALLERPGWLLRRIAEALQRLGRLPSPATLTPRDVATTAQLAAAADRVPRRALATAAARVRFGASAPAER